MKRLRSLVASALFSTAFGSCLLNPGPDLPRSTNGSGEPEAGGTSGATGPGTGGRGGTVVTPPAGGTSAGGAGTTDGDSGTAGRDDEGGGEGGAQEGGAPGNSVAPDAGT